MSEKSTIKETFNKQDQIDIISSFANIFTCSFYLDLERNLDYEIENQIPQLRELLGSTRNATENFRKVAEYLIGADYKETFLAFTNLSTINERLQGKTYISMQMFGPIIGWTEGIFIAGDRDENGNCKHVIWGVRDINEFKEKEEILTYHSNVDALTGLFNRRMYETHLEENPSIPLRRNYVFISMDLNELKIINDSLGHDAGDEAIAGAAECMKQCLAPNGHVYRTGGDEFCAIIYATEKQLKGIQKDFEETIRKWRGKLVSEISISAGYATKRDNPYATVSELSQIAEKAMYEEKEKYYLEKGIDRRGQVCALNILCSLYTRILKINITTGTYHVIFKGENEKIWDKDNSNLIFSLFDDFLESDLITEDTKDIFRKKTNPEYLREHFRKKRKPLVVHYMRKIRGEYANTVMEIVPAEDYSDHNQSLYLYVKSIG